MCCYPWQMWACPVGSGKRNPTEGYGIVHVEPNCFWLLPAWSYWEVVRTSFEMDTPTRWYRPYSCYFLYIIQTKQKNNNVNNAPLWFFSIKSFQNCTKGGLNSKQHKQTFRLIPFVCRDVGSDEPEYCKTCPLELPSRRTVKLSLSLADSISRLASLSVMPSTTEWLLIFNSTSPSCTLLSPPFVPSLIKILLPKTIPKSKRDNIYTNIKIYLIFLVPKYCIYIPIK